MRNLKSCPFCGHKARYHSAELTIDGKKTYSISITCTRCNSRTRRYLFGGASSYSSEEAYKNCTDAWNRRVYDF